MAHYLREISHIWSSLFPDGTETLADAESIGRLEGLMPSYSLKDRAHIMGMMNDGSLFPKLASLDERERVLQGILDVPGRILSLSLFFQDAICFSGPALAMRDLFSISSNDSHHRAFLRYWDGSSGYYIQISEDVYEDAFPRQEVLPDEAERTAAWVSLIQLWLVAFRHFIDPRKGRVKSQKSIQPLFELRGQSELANAAQKLGFNIYKTDKCTIANSNLPALQYVFETLSESSSGRDFSRQIIYLGTKTRQLLGTQKTYETPQLSIDEESRKPSYRAGRPLTQEYRRDRISFFLRYIYCPEQEPRDYPTSFAVIRDIFFTFFGRQPLLDLLHFGDLSGPPAEQAQNVQSPSPSSQLAQQLQTEGRQPDNNELSSPVSLEMHPPGSPGHGMDGVQRSVPLAAGFENENCKAPVSQRTPISIHSSASQILPAWFQSDVTQLVVFFLFDSREYYKFYVDAKREMQDTLNDLAKSDHYFLIIQDNEVKSLRLDRLVDEVCKSRLLLVGSRSKPGAMDSSEGISLPELEDYILKYDVTTGKRRAMLDDDNHPRPKKRAGDAA